MDVGCLACAGAASNHYALDCSQFALHQFFPQEEILYHCLFEIFVLWALPIQHHFILYF